MLLALDTPELLTTSDIQALVSHGYKAVGLYMRRDRCTRDIVNAIHDAGMLVWAIWEKGTPTSVDYFSAAQGQSDADQAVDFAAEMGIPHGKPIFHTADYDAAAPDLAGRVLEYSNSAHEYETSCGLLYAVYGNKRTCVTLRNAGLAHYVWQANPTGWSPEVELDSPDIIQKLGSVLNLNSDPDVVLTPEVLW